MWKLSTAPASSNNGFERCFAQGLDLSEFGEASTRSRPSPKTPQPHISSTTSASQQLAKALQKEANERQIQEKREVALWQATRQKAQALRTTSQPPPAMDAHAALLHMHAAEQAIGEPRHKEFKKVSKSKQKVVIKATVIHQAKVKRVSKSSRHPDKRRKR